MINIPGVSLKIYLSISILKMLTKYLLRHPYFNRIMFLFSEFRFRSCVNRFDLCKLKPLALHNALHHKNQAENMQKQTNFSIKINLSNPCVEALALSKSIDEEKS